MQRHAILLAIGLILGLTALAVIQPVTDAGSTFLVILVLAVVYGVGALAWRPAAGPKPEAAPPDKRLEP